MTDYKQIVKCTLVGDEKSGKSCFLNRWDKADEYLFNGDKYERTIGVEFAVKVVPTPNNSNERWKFQCWDTTGSRMDDRFQRIITTYFRGTHAFFLFFDVTNRDSFEMGVPFHIDLIDKYICLDEAIYFLIATKCDAPPHERKVTTEEAVALAKEKKFYYQETSAKTGAGVNDLFAQVATHASRYGFRTGASVRPTPPTPEQVEEARHRQELRDAERKEEERKQRKKKKNKGSFYPSLKNIFGKR